MKAGQFSEQEQEKLRAAIARAEQQTSGEIVPVIVAKSSTYEIAAWKGAAMLATLSLALAMVVFQFYHGWGLAWLYTGWGMAFTALASGVLGALAGMFIPAIKRRLVGEERMARTVHWKALEAFVAEEVFGTRDRTGILIFISLFEHRIEVMGDTGINKLVTADDWAHVVQEIRDGIKRGQLAEGLLKALDSCGTLLQRSGVTIRSDDTNELPNDVRFRG